VEQAESHACRDQLNVSAYSYNDNSEFFGAGLFWILFAFVYCFKQFPRSLPADSEISDMCQQKLPSNKRPTNPTKSRLTTDSLSVRFKYSQREQKRKCGILEGFKVSGTV